MYMYHIHNRPLDDNILDINMKPNDEEIIIYADNFIFPVDKGSNEVSTCC